MPRCVRSVLKVDSVMRLVLDTNVVVSAFFWGGTPRLLLDAGRARRAKLFTSTPLLAELT